MAFVISTFFSTNVFAIDPVAFNYVTTITTDFNGTHSNTNAISDGVKLYKAAAYYTSDLCTGGTAISSSGSLNAAMAFDNIVDDWDYYWSSYYYNYLMVGYDYVGYSFSTAKTIKKIRYYNNYIREGVIHGITSVILQAYVDGAWSNVQTLYLGSSNGWVDLFISPNVSSTQWRLLANAYIDYNYWFVCEVEMMEYINPLYATSGTYTHGEIDISSGVIANDTIITYNKTTPANTSLTVEARVYNGTTWSNWAAKNSGDSLVANGTNLTGYKVQWRANLSTSNPTVSPSLDDVTVSNSDNIAVTGVTLNKTSTTIAVNNTETLVATVAPTNATNKSVTWSSSNETVATVSSAGVVSALSAGTAVITVTTVDGSYTATCDVTAENRAVTGISVKLSTTIGIGQTETLVPTFTPADATNKAVTWSSGNTAIATVDVNGTVTGLNQGTTIITATSVDGSYTATCNVTVRFLSTYTIQYQYDANGNLTSMTISET